ncbi:MAG: putative metal-binding motif-containing protein [Myxococcota bacterium]
MKPLWLSTALLFTACNGSNGPVCDQSELLDGYTDADGDGFGSNLSEVIQFCPGFGDGLSLSPLDCNDEDAAINPDAVELCNGIDDDCDGVRDQGFDNRVYYPDADDDGFGARYPAEYSCIPLEGHVQNNTDCDDSDPFVNPGSPEICNGGIDDNCNGLSDDTDPQVLESSKLTFYLDADADGFGDPDASFEACQPQSNWSTNFDDCDDGNQAINPNATEICNMRDDDCDLLSDDADPSIDPNSQIDVFIDADFDGFGNPASPSLACFVDFGTSDNGDDCNDNNFDINPGVIDVCNFGIDDDCDPTTAEDDVSGLGYYVDTDGDGYGDTSTEILSCTPIANRVVLPDDCNESDTGINPGIEDVCEDGVDQDCTGSDARCRSAFEVSNQILAFTINNSMRGVVLEPTEDGLVIDFGIKATLSDACELDYYIWQRPDDNSPWSLLTSDQVLHEPATEVFFNSGELDVVVTAGTQVGYGVAWNNCPTSVRVFTATNNNVGTFELGDWVGWVRETNNYSGFNVAYTPPEFLTSSANVPNMEIGYSTSFVP